MRQALVLILSCKAASLKKLIVFCAAIFPYSLDLLFSMFLKAIYSYYPKIPLRKCHLHVLHLILFIPISLNNHLQASQTSLIPSYSYFPLIK